MMDMIHSANRSAPCISIGLPVFNGENHVRETLESILNQSHGDLEVIISDNASVDKTEEICLTYAKRDPRIRYVRNEKNIGAAANFNRVFALARGRFFKWAAHDDLMAPGFVEKCVEVLEKDASIVLCHTKTKIIDSEGKILESLHHVLARVGSWKPQERFRDLVLIDHPCTHIFGVIRASTLRSTPLIADYIASDRVLLAELGLLGRFHEIGEYLFFSREHPQRSTRDIPFHLRGEWFASHNTRRWGLPHWRFYMEYFRCLKRAPDLKPRERRRCYMHLLCWPGVNLNWARLLSDLIIAVHPASLGFFLKVRDAIRD